MSIPEDGNAAVYNKYFPIFNELQQEEDKLHNRIFVHQYLPNKTPHRGCIGPRGFAYEAFYFTELHWLVLIQDVLNRIKGLKERLAFYEKNKVERLNNEVFDELQKQGFTSLMKQML